MKKEVNVTEEKPVLKQSVMMNGRKILKKYPSTVKSGKKFLLYYLRDFHGCKTMEEMMNCKVSFETITRTRRKLLED